MRFENLERYEHDKERHGRLNPFQRIVTSKDDEDGHGREHQFENCKAKPVASWLHPEFHCEREQKQARDPGRERTEHGRQREKQRCRQPKQRSAWNAPIPFTPAHTHALPGIPT